MGLKTDILKAFEKNLTHTEVVNDEGKLKEKIVKPPTEKDSKLEVLAEDLANAETAQKTFNNMLGDVTSALNPREAKAKHKLAIPIS